MEWWSGPVDTTEGKYIIQRDLDRLAKQVHTNIRSDKAKCKVLYLNWSNPKYMYREKSCRELAFSGQLKS